MKYKLTDGQKQHKLYPDTFYVPSLRLIKKLSVGSIVKLNFTNLDGNKGERMWVEITERIDDNYFVGRLDNIPIGQLELGLQLNDRIEFESRHIIKIN